MRNLLTTLISLLICVALAEMVVRVALPRPGYAPFPGLQAPDLLSPNERRSYAYTPGFSGVVGTPPLQVDVSINELGMRDDPVATGETIHALAVGDSFTAGALVEVDEAWPARLEHHLNAGDDTPRRVLNAGVSGYNIEQIRYMAEDSLALAPDFIVVGAYPFVLNRILDPFVWFDGFAVRLSKRDWLKVIDDGFLNAVPGSRVSAGTQWWLMENFRLGAWVWLALAPAIGNGNVPATGPDFTSEAEVLDFFTSQLDSIEQAATAAGVQTVVFLIGQQAPNGAFPADVKRYNEHVRRHCEARGIPVFDPIPLLEAWPAEGPVFRAGGVDFHWSPLGHDLAAEGLAEFLVSLKPQPTAGD